MQARVSSRRVLPITLIGLALVAAGCGRSEAPPAPQAAANAPGAENASFRGLEGFPDPVRLEDGAWEGEPYVDGGSSYPAVYLSKHLTTRGDLDDDGRDEIAAVLVTTTGGTASLFHLVLLRETDSGLEHFATRFLGDRIRIRSLDIRDGGIDVVSIEAGEDDPLCCPTRRVARRFLVRDDSIVVDRETRSGPIERLFGFMTWGHESRSFKTCSGDREGWVVDAMKDVSIADLYEEFATGPYAPVFMDVEGRWFEASDEGFQPGFDDAVEITAVHRVEREGFGCKLDVEGLVFRAFGNEPGWRLDVRPDGATLTSMSLEERVEFSGDGRLSNQQFEFENDEYRMSVAYLEIPCRDSMSGSYFSHQAELRIGDRRYVGCAVPGR